MTTLTEHLIQAKAGLWKLFQHDVNMKQALLRGAAAKGFGLPPEQYAQPFPGETNLTVVSSTPDAPQAKPGPAKSGWLQTAILGGAIVASGAGAALIPGLIGPKAGPASVQPPPLPTTPAAISSLDTQAFDEIEETLQPDGNFKETKRWPFGVFPKVKGPVP